MEIEVELKTKLEQLYSRVKSLKEQINTEEATKNAFIMPFLQILGYDVFNPTEIIPEFVADIGTKKGEKVDYVIKKDDQVVIIIECKHWKRISMLITPNCTDTITLPMHALVLLPTESCMTSSQTLKSQISWTTIHSLP